MDEAVQLARRYTVYTLVIMFIVLLTGVFRQDSFFLGMAFGAGLSLLNLVSTYFQTKRIIASGRDRKYRFSFGTVGRMVTVVVGLLLAQQYPEYFDLIGLVIGLAVTYLLLMIDPLFRLKQLQ
ncbi:ATP synthase subunit I [Alkalicoccus chagannorensis]|uniref:ATP synthase subunit I n=1 Tax=Alkalicoccus chagannorensis TaxID=427072 RepID=UPI0003F86536|nr:ATP synthase subunit I [Alkalicoccus chagannorensis]